MYTNSVLQAVSKEYASGADETLSLKKLDYFTYKSSEMTYYK